MQFYGANMPGAKVTQGGLDQFWLWSIQSGLKNAYDGVKAFSEIYYPGAPHGLTATHQDQFNADLLAFLRS